MTPEFSRFLFRLIRKGNDVADLPDSFFDSYRDDLHRISDGLLALPEVVREALSWAGHGGPAVQLAKITTHDPLMDQDSVEDEILLEEEDPEEEDEKESDASARLLETKKHLLCAQTFGALHALAKEQDKARPDPQIIESYKANLCLRRKVIPSLLRIAEQAVQDGTLSAAKYEALCALKESLRQKERELLKNYAPLLSTASKNLARLEFRPHKIPAEDLFQEGLFGLFLAAERYAPTQKAAFLTYVQPWIYTSMTRTLGAHSSVPLPPGLYILLKNLYKMRRLHTTEEGRYRTKAELAELFALTDKQVAWRLFVPFHSYSLNSPALPYGKERGLRPFSEEIVTKATFADHLEDPEGTPEHLVANKEKAALLAELIEELSPRQGLALKGFFYKDQDSEAVARTLPTCTREPVSRSRVYQIKAKGQRTLRRQIHIKQLFRDLDLV